MDYYFVTVPIDSGCYRCDLSGMPTMLNLSFSPHSTKYYSVQTYWLC